MADHQCPTPTAMLIGTAIISLASGYMLAMASSLGFLPNPFAGPSAPRHRGDTSHYNDEEESSEEEIDDGVVIDHAPNWANGEEADKRDGLRASALKRRVAKENGLSGDGSETPKAIAAPVSTPIVAGTRQMESVRERRRRELKEARAECEKRGWDVDEDFKMVFVVRRDIAISIGKTAAQCGHATDACLEASHATTPPNPAEAFWREVGTKKIALASKTKPAKSDDPKVRADRLKKGEAELRELHKTAHELGLVAELIADAGHTEVDPGTVTVLGIGPGPADLINAVTGHLSTRFD